MARALPDHAAVTPALVSALGVAIVLAACARAADEPRVTTRDSAGVRIVESRAPAWTATQAWRVDSAPVLSVGAADGAAEYLFHLVRGVARLADGRIVVGDGGSGQLRFYDSTGTFTHATGRRGHGPGEFGESVMRVWQGASGDLFVEDGGNGRINVFSDAGWFVRAIQLARLDRTPAMSALGLFENGSILAVLILPAADSVQRTGDLEYPELLYLQFADDGRMLSHVLRARGSPRYVYSRDGVMDASPLPFGTTALPAVLGNALAFSNGARHEVTIWSTRGGDREGIFRWHGAQPRRVADVWRRYQDTYMERLTPHGRASYRYFYSLDLPLPERVPSLERLLGDADGNLWAKRYLLPWETTQAWDVLAPGGEWLGTVVTPSGLTVIQIGTDFVLGTHRDDLGVERVRLHRLHKPIDRPRVALH